MDPQGISWEHLLSYCLHANIYNLYYQKLIIDQSKQMDAGKQCVVDRQFTRRLISAHCDLVFSLRACVCMGCTVNSKWAMNVLQGQTRSPELLTVDLQSYILNYI